MNVAILLPLYTRYSAVTTDFVVSPDKATLLQRPKFHSPMVAFIARFHCSCMGSKGSSLCIDLQAVEVLGGCMSSYYTLDMYFPSY